VRSRRHRARSRLAEAVRPADIRACRADLGWLPVRLSPGLLRSLRPRQAHSCDEVLPSGLAGRSAALPALLITQRRPRRAITTAIMGRIDGFTPDLAPAPPAARRRDMQAFRGSHENSHASDCIRTRHPERNGNGEPTTGAPGVGGAGRESPILYALPSRLPSGAALLPVCPQSVHFVLQVLSARLAGRAVALPPVLTTGIAARRSV